MKSILIWGGIIRGLDSVQAISARNLGQVKSPFLTDFDRIKWCSLQGPAR
jgi:hypothetical protein